MSEFYVDLLAISVRKIDYISTNLALVQCHMCNASGAWCSLSSHHIILVATNNGNAPQLVQLTHHLLDLSLCNYKQQDHYTESCFSNCGLGIGLLGEQITKPVLLLLKHESNVNLIDLQPNFVFLYTCKC